MTPEQKGMLLLVALRLIAIFTLVMVSVAYATLLERKVSAWMQDRLGPNRVGPRGLLQPVADGLKNIIKEETMPGAANKVLFVLAPGIAFCTALMLAGVIPLAAPLPLDFDVVLPLIGRVVYHGPMTMSIADLPVGFLYIIAISSLGVYGIALAGWSSNSKYSLLGGLRAAAQLVSYEVAMGLSLVPVLLLSGNVAFGQIIADQQQGLWYVLPLPVAFFIFLVSGFAETNRAPFDLPEAESELVAGYHAEYSAMKFSMFFIAEYANLITLSMMCTTLFFGGWDIPFTHWDERGGVLQTLVTFAVFGLKTFAFVFLIMWVRWTLPRFRYDQLMALGWKVMMPMALVYLSVITGAIYVTERVLHITAAVPRMLMLTAVSAVAAAVIFVVLDRGLVISGAYRRHGPSVPSPARAPRRAMVR
ncbi:MAG: NADH-quinone oxidoreductase subunit NuoH [Gemmatimonadota bacterium]